MPEPTPQSRSPSASWRNKVGLSSSAVDLLAADFGELEERWPGLPARILRYLLDDEGAGVLLELIRADGCAHQLGLSCIKQTYPKRIDTPRARCLAEVVCDDAAFFLRLAHVYEACSRLPRRHLVGVFPAGLEWLEVFLFETTQLTKNMRHPEWQVCRSINGALVEAMLERDGQDPAQLIRAVFQPSGAAWSHAIAITLVGALPDFAERVLNRKEAVATWIRHADADGRCAALDVFTEYKIPTAPFAELLVELAVSLNNMVRNRANKLLQNISDAAAPLLEVKARQGLPEERRHAVQLLWNLTSDLPSARTFLRQRLEEDRAKTVVATIRELLSEAEPASSDASAAFPPPGPVPPAPTVAPLGQATFQALEQCFEDVNRALANRPHVPDDLRLFAREHLERTFEALQTLVIRDPRDLPIHELGVGSEAAWKPIRKFLERPELQLIHAARLLVALGAITRVINGPGFALTQLSNQLLTHFRKHHRPSCDLRELAMVFATIGLDPRSPATEWLESNIWKGTEFDWEAESIWPYFAEHLDLLVQAFEPTQDYFARQQRRNAFAILRRFPRPPPALLPMLWELALGAKSERQPAQECLEHVPNKIALLLQALGNGKAEIRIAAANWLERLRDPATAETLLAAVKKEKHEQAKAAMMTALEQLGVPVDQFLNRAGLYEEAVNGLGKASELNWLQGFPPVHWADTGEPVAPEIIRWWLAQGDKLKSPEPGALLRRYCLLLRPAEREALGLFVLQAWVDEDVTPISRNEAEQEARASAQQALQWAQYLFQHAQKHPDQFGPPQPSKTFDQYYVEALPGALRRPKGSAIGHKGVLALAAACGGSGMVPVVNRYLKEWYGMRAAQSRALLQMLAWIEHPAATQLLLAVGSRFRTKGIQEEANHQALALAERKGWTLAELADRTVPSAGLDENGVLTLDYGRRQFCARLNQDLELTLSSLDGKPIKILPEPRQDDDAAKASEARKLFSAAKKELKSVLTLQQDRLYEAMCTQRTWKFEDWSLYLNQHPIIRHYTQRLVWSATSGERTLQLFRPLPDGSLTDAADEPLSPPAEDLVRIAHECQVTPEISQTWRRHLQDYNIAPLFEQFGRPHYALAEDRKDETELTDFEGHLLEAFKLRGRATRLGYTRGQAQDGGWFYEYHKRFPTLEIEAIIEFTGNGLPEENRTVALVNLHFQQLAPENRAGTSLGKVALADVPAVLLSECWNDLRQLAAEGSGFEPDWRKKTQV